MRRSPDEERTERRAAALRRAGRCRPNGETDAMLQRQSRKPYTVAGAGPLTATIWKAGIDLQAGNYTFNLIRTNATGRVTQRFRPEDLLDFVKLIQVLAFILVDDGCLDPRLRKALRQLAERMQSVSEAFHRRSAKKPDTRIPNHRG